MMKFVGMLPGRSPYVLLMSPLQLRSANLGMIYRLLTSASDTLEMSGSLLRMMFFISKFHYQRQTKVA